MYVGLTPYRFRARETWLQVTTFLGHIVVNCQINAYQRVQDTESENSMLFFGEWNRTPRGLVPRIRRLFHRLLDEPGLRSGAMGLTRSISITDGRSTG